MSSTSWIAIARHGDPNPPFTADEPATMVLDRGPRLEADVLAEETAALGPINERLVR